MKHRFSCVLPLLICLAFLLVACDNTAILTSNVSASPTPQGQVAALAATGTFQEFTLPQNDDGLMRPALDGQGRLWFGEMNRNYLGSFNAQQSTFWQQKPPNGQAGIMGIVAAPDNTIWFAEQNADYIGHYFPTTGQYKTYPLPTLNTPNPSDTSKTLSLPSAPNDLVLDQHGTLWFTELNANAIGSLNTANGSIQQYPLTQTHNAPSLDPYGIALDPQGIVWFTEITSNQLGRLNPRTGQVSYFTPPGSTTSTPLMEIVSDAYGHIWLTTFAVSQLIRFDPTSQTFATYSSPTFKGGLYDLALAANGDIWVTVTSKNMLARLDMKAQRFLTYTIPTPNSLPIGLVVDKDQAIWFTESSSNKIGILRL
jgi:virginiamycin B lyase